MSIFSTINDKVNNEQESKSGYVVSNGMLVKPDQKSNNVSSTSNYRVDDNGMLVANIPQEQKPTKRGIMDRIFGVLGYSGITEGLYNMVDDDENSTFTSGLREGLKYMNPLTNDVSGRHTFSDFLEEAGWEDKNPDKLGLDDIGRGIAGFAGDVLTDPLTYINPYGAISKVVKGTGKVADVGGTLAKIAQADDVSEQLRNIAGSVNKSNLAHLKGLDRQTAYNIVKETTKSQGLSEDLLNQYADELVESFNSKVLKLREGGDDFTLGLNHLPFASKIKIGDKTLDSFKVKIASSKQLRELGDATISPYYNNLAKKLRTSRIAKNFSNVAQLEDMYTAKPQQAAAEFYIQYLGTGAKRINMDIDDIKIADEIKKYWESLDKDKQRAYLRAYEEKKFHDAIEFKKMKGKLATDADKREIEFYEEMINVLKNESDKEMQESLRNVFRIFGNEMANLDSVQMQKYVELADKLKGVPFDDIRRFQIILNDTSDPTYSGIQNMRDKITSWDKLSYLTEDEKQLFINTSLNNNATETDGLFDVLLANLDEYDNIDFEAYDKLQHLAKMESEFGEQGIKLAETIRDKMNKYAEEELDLGRLDRGQYEAFKNGYLTHIRNIDMAELEKAFEENNGSFIHEVFGKLKDFSHSRGKRDITAVDEYGREIFNTSLHEIYLYRSLAHNRLIYGSDVQNFIKDGFLTLLDDADTVNPNKVAVVNYEDLKSAIRRRALYEARKETPIDNLANKIAESKEHSILNELSLIGDEGWYTKYAPNIPLQQLNDAQIEYVRDKLKLKVYEAPEEILKRTNILSRAQHIQLTNETLNLYDRLLTIWKLNNTLIMPGFHLQNAVSNAFQSFLAISEDALNPKKLKRAYTIFTNPDPKQVMKVGDKEYTYKELNYMATKLGVIDEMFHTFEFNRSGEGGMLPHIPKGLDPTDVEGFVLNKIGTNVGTKIEGTQRMNLWLSCLEKGQTPEQAVETVNKYLFDYSDLTDFEQQTVKRIIPFYTFMKKNASMELEAMLTQPQKFVQLQKGFTNFEKMGGDYEGENERNKWRQEYIQIPNTGYGVSDQLPYNQLERIVDPQKVLGQTSPLIKTPLETIMGKYMYTGIDIGGPVEYIVNQAAPTKVAYNTANKDGVLNKILYAIGQLDGFPIGEM